MLKKIKERLLKDKSFFRLHEKDRYVFFPWFYPGEGIILNENQALVCGLFISGYSLAILTYVCVAIFLEEFTDVSGELLNALFAGVSVLALPVYFLFVSLMRIGKGVCMEEGDRPIINTVLFFLAYSLSQITSFLISFDEMWLGLMMFLTISFLFTNYFFIKILINKGRFFSN